MRNVFHTIITVAILWALSNPNSAFAGDALKVDGMIYGDGVKVLGLGEGGILEVVISPSSATGKSSRSESKRFEWKKIEWINFAGENDFNKAEDTRRDGQPSAQLYEAALKKLADRNRKGIAELRLSQVLDAEGKTLDSLKHIVAACDLLPQDVQFKPKHLPKDPKEVLKAVDILQQSDSSMLASWSLEMLESIKDPTPQIKAAIQDMMPKAYPLKLLGLAAGGRRVVYIIDHSASTVDDFDSVRNALCSRFAFFRQEQSFQVIMVAEKASPIFEKLQPATFKVCEQARKALSTYEARGMNDGLLAPFQDAFEKAFQLEPDVIFLVADASWDSGLLDVVAKLNPGREKKTKIYAIAFGKRNEEFEKNMKELSEKNNGKYTFVQQRELRR